MMGMAGTGAPAPRPTELQDLTNHGRRGGVGTGLRSMGAIAQALGAESGMAIEPLVAGLAADAMRRQSSAKAAGVCSA